MLLPLPSCCTNVHCVCSYLGSDFNIDLERVFKVVTRQCGITGSLEELRR